MTAVYNNIWEFIVLLSKNKLKYFYVIVLWNFKFLTPFKKLRKEQLKIVHYEHVYIARDKEYLLLIIML